ncbi:MAG: cyclic nucleotide-binding domain-containing protein [Atopobiaceae bacterium]|nr:cyclic nucleotide-binding domain-containing protein [Atopobiaceae bacterium]
MKDKALRKGTVVFSEGDLGDCMYLIRWGKVGAFANYGTPNEKKLGELTEGDYFGEMGLIDRAPRSATIVVLENDTLLSRIGEDEFAQFLSENPRKVFDIVTQLSHKLRNATKSYLALCQSISQSVGEGTTGVDATSNYGFGQNEHLREIHDKHAATNGNA